MPDKTRNLDGQISIAGILALVGVIVIMLVMVWFLIQEPSCDKECQIEIVGILEGFEQNSSKWNIRINNESFVFDYWDKHYMISFIGENVTLTCCERQVGSRSIYSLLSCYLTGEE